MMSVYYWLKKDIGINRSKNKTESESNIL